MKLKFFVKEFSSEPFFISEKIVVDHIRNHIEFIDPEEHKLFSYPIRIHFRTKDFCKDLFRMQMNRWIAQGGNAQDALLRYNIEFLEGKINGAFYHASPIINDSPPEDLIDLHRFRVFTFDGQGMICGDSYEKGPWVNIQLKGSCQGPISNLKHVQMFINEARITKENINNLRNFQKSYLSCVMPWTTFQSIMTLLDDDSLHVYAKRQRTQEEFISKGFPAEATLSSQVDKETPLANRDTELDYNRETVGGLGYWNNALDLIEDEPWYSKMIDEDDLVEVHMQDRDWCYIGPSIPQRILKALI